MRILTYLLFMLFLGPDVSVDQKEVSVALLMGKDMYQVGEQIEISFNVPLKTSLTAVLLVKGSWGVTALNVSLSEQLTKLTLPEVLTRKAGLLNLSVYVNRIKMDSAVLQLTPMATQQPLPEMYTGPRFLIAGGTDEAMMVATPLDSLDNPLPPNTLVNFKVRGKNTVYAEPRATTHLFSYYTFKSSTQTGIMTGHMQCLNSSSPDFDFFIKPSAPQDFTITLDRMHDESDGQQLISVITGQIKDSLDNNIVDGTAVRFKIESDNEEFYQGSNPTINGIARVEFPFPAKPEKWSILAYIPGYSESNVLEIDFSNSLLGMPIKFAEQNRKISIGPLKTIFGNRVSDGTQIIVQLQKAKKESQFIATTRLGWASLDLSAANVPDGVYNIIFNSNGLKQIKKNVKVGS